MLLVIKSDNTCLMICFNVIIKYIEKREINYGSAYSFFLAIWLFNFLLFFHLYFFFLKFFLFYFFFFCFILLPLYPFTILFLLKLDNITKYKLFLKVQILIVFLHLKNIFWVNYNLTSTKSINMFYVIKLNKK